MLRFVCDRAHSFGENPILCATKNHRLNLISVTGINVHLITPIVCIVCIFYTSVGGLKAVVWTDVIQLILMFGAICIVAIKGTYDVGGLDVVWDRAVKRGRIEGPE